MDKNKNYILIAMNYMECNFEKLREEWDKYKKIHWGIPVKPAVKGDKLTLPKNSDLIGYLHKEDIVYFYVSGIPTNSGGTKSRILLRGVIEDAPYVAPYNEVYLHEDNINKKDIIAFSIGQLTTLAKEQLKDDSYLSYEILSKNFGDKFYPQGKRWPNKHRGNLSTELIDLLETSFKKNLNKNDFLTLITHFNQKCYFCGKIGTANDHKTFKRRNGTDYYEYHHFIQQCKGNKLYDLNGIIQNPSNIICLCSNCHNKIHYGKIQEVNQMLNVLWNDDEIQMMLKNYDFQSIIGENTDPFEWIKSVYNSNKKDIARSDSDNI